MNALLPFTTFAVSALVAPMRMAIPLREIRAPDEFSTTLRKTGVGSGLGHPAVVRLHAASGSASAVDITARNSVGRARQPMAIASGVAVWSRERMQVMSPYRESAPRPTMACARVWRQPSCRIDIFPS